MSVDRDRTSEQLRLALVYGNVGVESGAPHAVRTSAARFLRATFEEIVGDAEFWSETERRARVAADMELDPERLADLLRVLQDIVGAELAATLTASGYRFSPPPSPGRLIAEVQQLIRLDASAARQLGDVRVALEGFVQQLDLDHADDEPRAVRRWLLKGRTVAATLVVVTFRTASLQVSPVLDALPIETERERTADAVVASAGISAVREALAASRIRTGLGPPSTHRVGTFAERVLRRLSTGSPQLDVEEKLLAAQQRAASGKAPPDSTPRYGREVLDILKVGQGREARNLRRDLALHEDESDSSSARNLIDRTVDRLRIRASLEDRAHAWEERIKAYTPWRSGSGKDADADADADALNTDGPDTDDHDTEEPDIEEPPGSTRGT